LLYNLDRPQEKVTAKRRTLGRLADGLQATFVVDVSKHLWNRGQDIFYQVLNDFNRGLSGEIDFSIKWVLTVLLDTVKAPQELLVQEYPSRSMVVPFVGYPNVAI
jgi:hypothetical protein